MNAILLDWNREESDGKQRMVYWHAENESLYECDRHNQNQNALELTGARMVNSRVGAFEFGIAIRSQFWL